VEEIHIGVMLVERSVGRFCGWRCQSAGRHFSTATVARGGLRSALSGGQRFREEARVWAVLEEVALAQLDRRWLARKCTALQCGGAVEQGGAKWSLASPFDIKAMDKGDGERGCTWGGVILGVVETGATTVCGQR
jgi:hypothetical protein